MQEENKARVDKKAAWKRKKTLGSFKNLQDKNEINKTTQQFHQCIQRVRSISNQQGKEDTFNFLNKIMKVDPNKQEQREKLIIALKELNRKCEFGLKLELPSHRSEKAH